MKFGKFLFLRMISFILRHTMCCRRCFDEPTSALDPELTGEVLKVLRNLADKKTTMIIVTHEMAFARDVASQVIFMDDGYILEQGRPEEVFDNPEQERTKQFLSSYS